MCMRWHGRRGYLCPIDFDNLEQTVTRCLKQFFFITFVFDDVLANNCRDFSRLLPIGNVDCY
jgi:hypothetical protein